MAKMIAAVEYLEEAVLGAEWTEGIVLRYGAFYGPGTSMAPGSEQFELIRKRRFPVVGDGGGVWSFVHIADAAEATVAAVERGGRGLLIAILERKPGKTHDRKRAAGFTENPPWHRAGLHCGNRLGRISKSSGTHGTTHAGKEGSSFHDVWKRR